MTVHFTPHAIVDGPIDDALCPLYEMPREWCHHCKTGHLPPRGYPGMEHPHDSGEKLERRGDQLDDGLLIAASFEAKYPGYCHNHDCGQHYKKGAWIHRTSGGHYICGDCGT
jgi:hypothetical protein